MNFLKLFCYIIATFGICELIIYFDGPFSILDKFRKLMGKISAGAAQVVSCFACLSTWVGIILSVVDLLIKFNFTPFNIIFGSTWDICWLIIPLDAAFTCGTTWLLHQLEDLMEARMNNNEYNEEEYE